MSLTQERYEKWVNHPNLDARYKDVLENMNEEEKNDAFYTLIEFGTAGMRGLLGPGTNRINIHTIRKATQGYANYIIAAGKEACEKGIAIGYDNRHMSREFAFDCADLLAKNNIRSYVFESLRPTPELSFAVRHLGCFGGIMITASHNPKEYNGYKLYDDKGCQLIPSLAAQVIDQVNAIEDELAIDANCTEEQKKLITVIGKDVDEEYYKNVLSIQLNPDVNKDIKIVFSPEHGTANIPVQEVYKRAGYTCIPVEEQCTPDPDFSNTPTPNPEQPGAYELALEYAKKNDADLILVCDPDADRMGVGVKHNGEYVVLTGNQSGSVEIEYICSQLTKQNKMPENPVMFNTVVTSDLGEKVAADYGVTTEKTLTGFKFIGEKVAKYEVTHEKNYVFGYEESYGSLIKPFVRDKDAPQACLMLAEACAYYKQEGKDLVDVLDSLYDRHGTYEESQVALTLSGEAGANRIKEILANLRKDSPAEIGGTKVVKSEDYKECVIKEGDKVTELTGFTKSDVLKYYLEDGSWIAVRPSGTEPKCKFYYCIKGASKEDAHNKTVHFQQAMKELTQS
ncbi:phospho-sugar mutase [Faecalitalea cylindroides]|uniref:phospho-sugar mutase n=1 Tax=Faecalitalea cylindroides TaxID=39483 RepID=UPI001898C975|nr:phospho-sugar mutase [Faecalitalea cylindroides]MBM6651985.1 phospho-sugar mutase [Faecalitalea cylindroides]MDB7952331.1 phospho-sugar mutase [Faecalitalea cylindroides]MDB7959041.1 phospho-sugar mutase [Faecalitalea cylindroides]MDB7960782.1 phospho-sugar mutase [Faecalitalea cylindroides]MDB7962969.1 phospho-sugar mutase [Faecalitalea cylindroides]